MTISCNCGDCGQEIDRVRDRFACATCFERHAQTNPTRCLACLIRHRFEAHPDVKVEPERIDDDLLCALARHARQDPIMRRTMEAMGFGENLGKLFSPEGTVVVMPTTERVWNTGHDACRGLGCPVCCPVDAT